MRRDVFKIGAAVLILFAGAVVLAQERKNKEQELARYYDKWLNQDVVYIITDEERAVFEKLSTTDEKDNFIEQFWFRRNADPRTSINEFKEEHYRRIAYANATFGSGMPGWKSDRGRIYIMFGEPAEIERHSGGGTYVRKQYEGGGHTATYPFEVWRYRSIPGVGQDVEIEFVDRSWTGEYKMAANSWEKDLLLNVPDEGLTTAERLGYLKKVYRPGLHPGNLNDPSYQAKSGMRSKDTPFESMLRYYALQRPPEIKQKDLQELVDTRISYTTLPFSSVLHYLWLSADAALVPITVEISNASLSYKPMAGFRKARVGLYGRVTSLTGALVTEFEDRIASEYPDTQFELGQRQKSLYQKSISIKPGRYKLDLVVKDLNSGNIGIETRSIYVPGLDKDKMVAGPIVLAKMVEPLRSFPDVPQTFVIGDVRVVPSVTQRFKPADEMGVYLQVYNPAMNTETSQPAVNIEFSIVEKGKVVSQVADFAGNSIEYFSTDRLVLVRKLKLDSLEKGSYKLTVKVSDPKTGRSTSSEVNFEIVAVS
ncbi:MAG TPA: GWxTD domain-containing protein [Acidobacteriota bacterium]